MPGREELERALALALRIRPRRDRPRNEIQVVRDGSRWFVVWWRYGEVAHREEVPEGRSAARRLAGQWQDLRRQRLIELRNRGEKSSRAEVLPAGRR